MRIFIVTNSQGSSVGVAPGENYPALVGKALGPKYDVRALIVSGWSVVEVVDNLVDNVISVKPDAVFVHIGIVESAQRILSTREKAVCALLPFGRYLTAALYRRRARVLRWRKQFGLATRAISPESFAVLVDRLFTTLEAEDIRCAFVPIPLFPDAGAAMEHPFVNEDATLYNKILTRYECIDLGGTPAPQYYQPGTVHFTAEGHRWLSEAVVRHIQRKSTVAA